MYMLYPNEFRSNYSSNNCTSKQCPYFGNEVRRTVLLLLFVGFLIFEIVVSLIRICVYLRTSQPPVLYDNGIISYMLFRRIKVRIRNSLSLCVLVHEVEMILVKFPSSFNESVSILS